MHDQDDYPVPRSFLRSAAIVVSAQRAHSHSECAEPAVAGAVPSGQVVNANT